MADAMGVFGGIVIAAVLGVILLAFFVNDISPFIDILPAVVIIALILGIGAAAAG